MSGAPFAPLRSAPREVSLRPVTYGDRMRTWGWNADPSVRAQSLDPRPIDAETHLRWFAARMVDPLTRMWIIQADRDPVGLVRLQRPRAGAPATISIVIDHATRSCGLGRAAIQLACRADGGPVVAEIRSTNLASIACFVAAGFAAAGESAPGVGRFLWSHDHV
jgi:L-amino acid N-acyltransferase YncA